MRHLLLFSPRLIFLARTGHAHGSCNPAHARAIRMQHFRMTTTAKWSVHADSLTHAGAGKPAY